MQLTHRLGISTIGGGGGGSCAGAGAGIGNGAATIVGGSPTNLTAIRNSKLNADLGALDLMVTTLLERHNNQQLQQQQSTKELGRSASNSALNRLKSFSFRRRSSKVPTSNGVSDDGFGANVNDDSGGPSATMPTIMETNGNMTTMSDRPNNVTTGVRQIINTITNAPHRFSHSSARDEENTNLTQNMLD